MKFVVLVFTLLIVLDSQAGELKLELHGKLLAE